MTKLLNRTTCRKIVVVEGQNVRPDKEECDMQYAEQCIYPVREASIPGFRFPRTILIEIAVIRIHVGGTLIALVITLLGCVPMVEDDRS
jgi:hypothetical protein